MTHSLNSLSMLSVVYLFYCLAVTVTVIHLRTDMAGLILNELKIPFGLTQALDLNISAFCKLNLSEASSVILGGHHSISRGGGRGGIFF